MYRKLYLPLDNSDHSVAASQVAIRLAKASGAEIIGSHVYAARLHDYRFKQMEYTLPEEYQDEAELERQRKIHDSLITTGLQLISDSYLDETQKRCLEQGIQFTPKTFDGKNWEVLVKDINESDYDLVLMGACGLGQVKETQIGTCVDRVVRRAHRDTLVVRHREGREPFQGPIVVAIDGSPQSFAGLRTALELGRMLDLPVEAVSVYDPYLHYVLFNGIVGVLSEKASKVFRFKEQEALHEEIIDTGLAMIYSSHLKVARDVAKAEGVDLPITLLDGKAFEQVLRYVREKDASLLVCGRIGVHSDQGMDLGGNTENLLRLAPCSVLLSSRTYVPPIDVRGAASVVWTPEANSVIERIPCSAQGLSRTAVLRWAMERGHSIISQDIVTAALGDILPPEASVAIGVPVPERNGAAVDFEVNVCRDCGYTARGVLPVVCPVCGGPPEQFSRVDHRGLMEAAADEGEVTEELTFDNRKIGWSNDARTLLHEMPAGYLRRRIKAKVEKVARTRRLSVVTLQVAAPLIEPELGRSANAQPHRTPLEGELAGVAAAAEANSGFDGATPDSDDVDRALLTYAAGGAGGRYVPREASPTIARLRPREEGTTPGFAVSPETAAEEAAEGPPESGAELAKCPVLRRDEE
ncbi:MAG TPA: universal stress protein [Candidatus Dormibacteraeota bacterium]|nr:universal stress protein [Candidatus Dormibacteraeota bacterium]